MTIDYEREYEKAMKDQPILNFVEEQKRFITFCWDKWRDSRKAAIEATLRKPQCRKK